MCIVTFVQNYKDASQYSFYVINVINLISGSHLFFLFGGGGGEEGQFKIQVNRHWKKTSEGLSLRVRKGAGGGGSALSPVNPKERRCILLKLFLLFSSPLYMVIRFNHMR